MSKRPTHKPLQPNIKHFAEGKVLYKGISNNARVYEKPVFFTNIKRHAEKYAKARLGQYATKRPLKLLELTNRTLKWLLRQPDLSNANKNLVTFVMGVNVTVANQMKLINKIVTNQGHRNHIRRVMTQNLMESGARMNAPGGRKSFMNTNLRMYRSLCGFCRSHGFDGLFVEDLKSPFHHPLFGSELVLCDPRNSLVNVNFKLAGNASP